MVKDTATILAKRVSTNPFPQIERKMKKFWDGSTLIPDIVAVNKYGYSECFEVECGNHDQANFNTKRNKLLALGDIIIIGQNRDLVARILKPQVDRWIKTKGKNVIAMSGVKVYLYSLTDFAKEHITYYYDMVSDEPICRFKIIKKGD